MNHAELVVVIDESGSMWGLTNDSIGGFNAFLEEQRSQPGEASLTIMKFNTTHSKLFEGPLRDAPLLSAETYRPNGGTALCDAVGAAIAGLDARIAVMPEGERPSRVVFGILTDGEENSSVEYKMDDVKALIQERQDKQGWVFAFLASNQDAFVAGGRLGVAAHTTYGFGAGGQSLRGAYATMSSVMSGTREDSTDKGS